MRTKHKKHMRAKHLIKQPRQEPNLTGHFRANSLAFTLASERLAKVLCISPFRQPAHTCSVLPRLTLRQVHCVPVEHALWSCNPSQPKLPSPWLQETHTMGAKVGCYFRTFSPSCSGLPTPSKQSNLWLLSSRKYQLYIVLNTVLTVVEALPTGKRSKPVIIPPVFSRLPSSASKKQTYWAGWLFTQSGFGAVLFSFSD